MRIKRGLKKGLAETRKIKIGGKGATRKSKTGKEFQMPERWDHFKITLTTRDDTGNFIVDKETHDIIGTEPRQLSVMMPYDDVDLNFPTAYVYYKGKKLICIGDAEKAMRGEKQIKCEPEKCPHAVKGECKISGRLHCILSDAPALGCVAVLRTHSFHSVSNILNGLDSIAENTGGILRGLPLRLELLDKETADHGIIRVANISFIAGDLKKLRESAIEEKQQRELLCIDVKMIEQKAIAEGDTEDHDDPAEVAAEFAPETGTAAEEAEDKALEALGMPEELGETFEQKKARLKAAATNGS